MELPRRLLASHVCLRSDDRRDWLLENRPLQRTGRVGSVARKFHLARRTRAILTYAIVEGILWKVHAYVPWGGFYSRSEPR